MDYKKLLVGWWCVPTRSTVALAYNKDIHYEQFVQVVWNITDVVNNEYIVGKCYSKFQNYKKSDLYGMINNSGKITMMFETSTTEDTFSTGVLLKMASINPKFPYNNLYKQLKYNYVFQMQVNLGEEFNPDSNTYMLHNAYMVRTSPQTPIWFDLPIVRMTVPDFVMAVDEYEASQNDV